MKENPARIKFLDDLEPVIDEQALYRYLGYPEGTSPDRRVVGVLERLNTVLPNLLCPCGIWGVFAGRQCFDDGFLLYDREVALCIVTIGDALERQVAEYASCGETLTAFVLDTLGSVYAEGAAEAAYRVLADRAHEESLELGCRISPGYGTWQLGCQKRIFDLLPGDKIGVRLTSGLMMVPRKSVSFAAERSTDPLRLREGDQCASCTMERCRYRLDP